MGWVRALGALVASANFVNCFVSLSFFFLFFFNVLRGPSSFVSFE